MRLAKLEALVLTRYCRPLRDAQVLAALLGLLVEDRYPAMVTTPQREKDDTLIALVELTAANAVERPTAVFFEDVHWADPTTIDFLELLIDRTRHLPLLLVLTHRPEFQPTWHRHSHVTALALSRLSRRQSVQAINKIAGQGALPNDLIEQLVAKADGVPLYLEELTKTVLESAQVVLSGDRAAAATEGGTITLPASLRDSLMARLDRAPDVKIIAQTGAAIGREFHYSLLAAIAPFEPSQLDESLNQLVESGLAFRRGAGTSAIYTFKHALVQDAAYDSLLKSHRQELHRRIAAALEILTPAAKATEPELFARHYTAADQPEMALPLWYEAGRLAMHRTAADEAVAHLNTALALVPNVPPSKSRDAQELDIRVALSTSWILRGDWQVPEVRVAMEPALPLAHALRRQDSMVPVYFGLWANLIGQGRIGDALRWIPEVLTIARTLGSRELALLGIHMGVISKSWSGDWMGARAHGGEIYSLYDSERDHVFIPITASDVKQSTDLYAGYWTWMTGYPDQAAAISNAKDTHARALSHPFLLCFSLTFGALVCYFRGDADALEKSADEAVAVAREFRLPIYFDALGPINKGLAALLRGHNQAAISLVSRGMAVWKGTGAGVFVPALDIAMAEAHAALNDLNGAMSHIDASLDQVQRPGWEEYAWHSGTLCVKGQLVAQGGDLIGAESWMIRAVDVARAQNAKSLELRGATALARLWRTQRKPRDAYALLAPIYDWFTEGFDTKDLKDAKALLDDLSSDRHVEN